MNGDLVDRIAAQFLSPYWKDRLSGSSYELPRAFYERYLHGVKLQPAEPIEPSALEGLLRERLGKRVSIKGDRRSATIRIEPVTRDTVKQDLGAIKDTVTMLETHAEIRHVGLSGETAGPPRRDDAEEPIALAISLDVPLQNLLHFEAPKLPLQPLARSGAPRPGAADFDEQTCPHCRALHVIAYGRKSHAQGSDNISFPCLACGRVLLVALGIPELVGYRIDLAKRMPLLLWLAYKARAWSG